MLKDENGNNLDYVATDEPGNRDGYHTVYYQDENGNLNKITLDEPFFDIVNFDVPNEVGEGDSFDVTATVDNTDGREWTDTIEYKVDGSIVDSIEETIEDSTTDISFTDSISSPGTYTIGISSNDDSNTATLSVLEEAYFDVYSISAPSSVEVGESFNVTGYVENDGEETDTQTLNYNYGGSSNVTLDGGESTSESFYDSGFSSSGSRTLRISSNDDSYSTTLDVLEDAYFNVYNISAPSSVEVGESFNVTASVRNNGETSDTQSVSYNNGGSSTVSLSGGQSTSESFSDSGFSSSGSKTLTISSYDDSDSTTIDVLEEAYFDVYNVSAPSTVKVDESFYITGYVENTGEATDTQSVSYNYGGSSNVTLDGGESTSESFYESGFSSSGSRLVRISTDDNNYSTYVTVEPSEFVIYENGSNEHNISYSGSGAGGVYDPDYSYDESSNNGYWVEIDEQFSATSNVHFESNTISDIHDYSTIEYDYEIIDNGSSGGWTVYLGVYNSSTIWQSDYLVERTSPGSYTDSIDISNISSSDSGMAHRHRLSADEGTGSIELYIYDIRLKS